MRNKKAKLTADSSALETWIVLQTACQIFINLKHIMTTSGTAFSSSDTAALERQVDLDESPITLEQIWNEAHRKVCMGWIKHNSYKRVCLQFPDCYLEHSVAISDSLKQMLEKNSSADTKIFILADTSYGSCCVDEIAAAHVEADSLIHFGNACRSKVSRLPVLYMFPHLAFDEAQFLKSIETLKSTCTGKSLGIYLDIGYHHLLEADDEVCLSGRVKEVLQAKEAYAETFPTAEDSKAENEPQEDMIGLFIGADNSRFLNLSLTTKTIKWFIYDPATNTLNEKNPLTANYIRRRYYYIEKCKDAQTLGLIVATLTAKGYLDVVSRLQEMAKSRGVKTQIISVGRINSAKLANFLEIDCFVLIGCPFNNVYNSKEFYKPIVSVFEAEMALNPAWHLKYPEAYVTDFKQLLPEGRSFLPFEASECVTQDVSLVSGRIRGGADSGSNIELADTSALSEQQQALIAQGKLEIMTSNTGLTFEDRTWKGLDPALGCTEPAKIQKGLRGVPIRYTND